MFMRYLSSINTHELIETFAYFIVSFLITFIVTNFFILLSKYLNIDAYPNHRKLHAKTTPLIGGICILVSLTISLFVIYLIKNEKLPAMFYDFYILLSAIIILFAGFLDDKYNLNVKYKLIFQLIASSILVFNVDFIYSFNWDFIIIIDNLFISNIVSIFFILLIINAINFIDGLDGLLLGVSIIILVSFIVIFSYLSLDNNIFILIVITACFFSILMFNKFPAKIFLGDLGSMSIGWFFAIYSFYFSNQMQSTEKIVIPIILLSIPILDVLAVIYVRFHNNQNLFFLKRIYTIFKSDRNHFHHIVLSKFNSDKKAVLIIYFFIIASFFISIITWTYFENLNYGIILAILFFLLLRKVIKY